MSLFQKEVFQKVIDKVMILHPLQFVLRHYKEVLNFIINEKYIDFNKKVEIKDEI